MSVDLPEDLVVEGDDVLACIVDTLLTSETTAGAGDEGEKLDGLAAGGAKVLVVEASLRRPCNSFSASMTS